jgi:DNA-binding Lrp family transcriptional regulator
MALKAELDAIDWKILKELQDDGRMTNVELARRVGISAPPCLRRVKRLEEAGIIRGYRALLSPLRSALTWSPSALSASSTSRTPN